VDIFGLCDVVRETGYAVHRYHRHGHLEKIYENAMINRLRKVGLKVEQQVHLAVYDEDGSVLGDLKADLFVERTLLVEIKAVKHLLDEHTAQLLGYLRAARLEHGVLMNFGGPRFKHTKVRTSGSGSAARSGT
jgi:GxxExxY protein